VSLFEFMTEPNINYHKHIEQAIQNVLSKVKKIPLPDQQEEQFEPISSETADEISMPLKHSPENTEESESNQPQTDSEEPLPQSEPEITYLEADDLYTPIPLETIQTPETEEEPPIVADTYLPPYNIFEEFVETELNIMLSRYIDLCRCSQCRADIVAIALHQLPAYYVTGTRGTLTAKSLIWTKYTQQIIDAVSKAINIVYKRPRSNCKKIKQMIWLKPDIEDVSLNTTSNEATAGALFEKVQSDNVELSFSNEVEEIIQLIEQGDSQDKAELLPVSSPYVHKAAPIPPSFEQVMPEQNAETASENPAKDDNLTMELIEDWD